MVQDLVIGANPCLIFLEFLHSLESALCFFNWVSNPYVFLVGSISFTPVPKSPCIFPPFLLRNIRQTPIMSQKNNKNNNSRVSEIGDRIAARKRSHVDLATRATDVVEFLSNRSKCQRMSSSIRGSGIRERISSHHAGFGRSLL